MHFLRWFAIIIYLRTELMDYYWCPLKRLWQKKLLNWSWLLIMQISMSVHHTTVFVAVEPSAKTPLAALRAPRPVLQDSQAMAYIVWVSNINDVCNVYVYPHHDSSLVHIHTCPCKSGYTTDEKTYNCKPVSNRLIMSPVFIFVQISFPVYPVWFYFYLCFYYLTC